LKNRLYFHHMDNVWFKIINQNQDQTWLLSQSLQAIKICSDVTLSYVLMQSDRRGLWWICNEFKPLPAYTNLVVSLWFSFEDFSQVFQMRVLRGLYWISAP
jgi:hypothetical protein